MEVNEFCWIPSCKNFQRLDRNVKLYPLPDSIEAKTSWAKAFGLDPNLMNSQTRICASHFINKSLLQDMLVAKNLTFLSGGNLINLSLLPNANSPIQLPEGANIGQIMIPPLQIPVNKPVNSNLTVPDQVIDGVLSGLPIPVNKPLSSNVTVPDQVFDGVHSVMQIPANKPVYSNVTVLGQVIDAVHSGVQIPVNKRVLSNVSVPDEGTDGVYSEKREDLPSTMRKLLMCELLLECQEENLTDVQKNFHSVEWMDYVKYNANIRQLPHVSAVNGAELGERVSDTKTASELPLLIFSNASPNSQAVITASGLTPAFTQSPIATPISSNTSLLRPVPPQNISSDLKLNISSPATVIATPSVLSPQPVFPVKLEKVAQPSLKPSAAQPSEEEVFPLISSDCLTADSAVNQPLPNGVELSVLTSDCVASVSNSVESSSVLRIDSPVPSEDSGSCLSPGQLCNVEITIDETDTLPLYKSPTPPVSEFLSMPSVSTPSLDTEDSNGPRIVGVLSGNAVANAFFSDDLVGVKVMDVEPTFMSENNTSVESTPSESSMPKTVTQWSIFAMQKTIAVISSGSLEASIHNLLGIRPNIPPVSPEKDVGTSLKTRLREENFMTLAVWWLVEKRFLPLRPPCECGSKIYKMNTNYTFSDGLCWKCIGCNTEYPAKRPRFFDLFPQFSLEELMLLTYHWACKSRIWVISKDVPVKEEKIWSFFSALQKLCGNYISKSCQMGKNSKVSITVEVSAVKLGKFFILCAFDRRNKVTRLQALTTEEACGTLKHIQILEEWLGPYCTLITWKKIGDEFLPGVNKVSADPSITQVLSPGRHILNASKYLGKTMVQLFQNISHDQLTLDAVQGFLNEVQWRERFGRIEESAFWGILNEISRMNENYSYTEAVLGEIAKDRYFYKSDITFQMRWGPFEIGAKSSWTYNPSDVSDQAKQGITNSIEKTTKKMRDAVVTPCPSTSKQYAEEITAAKKKHPISLSYSVPHATNAGNKIFGELINSQDLLSIRITFSVDEKYEKALKSQADNLGEKLRKEGFLRRPVRWLVNQHFIQDETLCYVCRGKAKLVDNIKFSDGVSWLCQKFTCKFENRFKRPSFFASFGFRLDFLFAIIYHWAVQSEYRTVIKSVPLNEFNIISVHRRIQKICTEIIKRPNCRIGGKKFLVEVALVKFANCFILGAMERDTKLSRFRAFSIQTKLHIDAIRKTLISWLHPGSTVIVNSNKYLGQYCMEEKIHLVFADREVKDMNSDKYHTLTISHYLQSHLKGMFSSIKVHCMSADLLQIYLDELVWRERYGRSPALAFQQIFRDIFAMEHGAAGNFSLGVNRDATDVQSDTLVGTPIPVPLQEVRVVLERLPEHVIEKYTRPVEQIKIVDSIELNKEIKQEVVSDDEIEIIKFVPHTEKLKRSPKSPASSSLASSMASSSLAASSLASSSLASLPLASSSIASSSLASSPSTSSMASLSIASSSIVKENQETRTNIKPRIEKHRASTAVAVVKYEDRKRYSDKCYTHRKKMEDLLHAKFRCMECKDVATLNHFVKWFSCADCKYNTYTTCCPKAYAQHRSPILFGKKMAKTLQEFEGTLQRKILLPQFWSCSCGYSSNEGNKLATHLIHCKKTTCYLQHPEQLELPEQPDDSSSSSSSSSNSSIL